MELKTVRKYPFLLLGKYYFYNLLFSHTVKIFPTWKSSLTEYSSWKEKYLDYFFFNSKPNELQAIPTSCMKHLEKSHNDFRDWSHWENINIFWCLYLYSKHWWCQNIVVSNQREKKYNLIWYNLFLPRVEKDSWMGCFLVWKAYINADFFFHHSNTRTINFGQVHGWSMYAKE